MVKIGARLKSPTRRELREALRNERRAHFDPIPTTPPNRPVSGTQLAPTLISDTGFSSRYRKARRSLTLPEDIGNSKKMRERRREKLSEGRASNLDASSISAEVLRFVASHLELVGASNSSSFCRSPTLHEELERRFVMIPTSNPELIYIGSTPPHSRDTTSNAYGDIFTELDLEVYANALSIDNSTTTDKLIPDNRRNTLNDASTPSTFQRTHTTTSSALGSPVTLKYAGFDNSLTAPPPGINSNRVRQPEQRRQTVSPSWNTSPSNIFLTNRKDSIQQPSRVSTKRHVGSSSQTNVPSLFPAPSNHTWPPLVPYPGCVQPRPLLSNPNRPSVLKSRDIFYNNSVPFEAPRATFGGPLLSNHSPLPDGNPTPTVTCTDSATSAKPIGAESGTSLLTPDPLRPISAFSQVEAVSSTLSADFTTATNVVRRNVASNRILLSGLPSSNPPTTLVPCSRSREAEVADQERKAALLDFSSNKPIPNNGDTSSQSASERPRQYTLEPWQTNSSLRPAAVIVERSNLQAESMPRRDQPREDPDLELGPAVQSYAIQAPMSSPSVLTLPLSVSPMTYCSGIRPPVSTPVSRYAHVVAVEIPSPPFSSTDLPTHSASSGETATAGKGRAANLLLSFRSLSFRWGTEPNAE